MRGGPRGTNHGHRSVTPTATLVVEAGPDKGLEIVVPAAGARVGRASGNDVVLHDPALSRFHCRFYFKDGQSLHVSDLASTNETLVNSRPSPDGRLQAGDRITIGETIIKVARDAKSGPAAPPPPAAPPAAAPAEPPASAPTGEKQMEIDLGLDREDGFESARSLKPKAPLKTRMLLYAGVAVLVVAAVGISAWLMKPRVPRRPRAAAAAMTGLEIHFEKVEAGPKNIFRYAVTLEGGVLRVRIDNLQDGQHVSREKKSDPKVLELLATSLEQTGFFQLVDEYQGLSPGVWEQADLTIVANRRAHRVRILNRLQPEAFKKAREEIEEFVRNEIGLYALALPPEKLVEIARNAWLTGQKLFDEREVRHDNLARTIKSLSEAESLVETLEPKPDFYEKAIALREEARRILQAKYEDYLFRADRSIKLNDWKEANAHLQVLLETVSDRADERYDTIYKKLVDVQRRLNRK